MDALLEVKVAQLNEVRHMIESHAVYSKGIGLTDAHLIASCLMTPGTQLWTRDASIGKGSQLSRQSSSPGLKVRMNSRQIALVN